MERNQAVRTFHGRILASIQCWISKRAGQIAGGTIRCAVSEQRWCATIASYRLLTAFPALGITFFFRIAPSFFF
jgi:hypothetical protein